MAYNIRGVWNGVTSCSSPWENTKQNVSDDSIKNGIEYFVKNSSNPEKFNLGMSLWGITFTLKDPKESGVSAPISM